VKVVFSDISDYEEAVRIFVIDLSSGVITRRIRTGQRGYKGSIAGFTQKGRRWIRFRGKRIPATRLIWLYAYGYWPRGQVDHINGDSMCDRIDNLRDVDRSTNLENLRKARADNRLGVLGVRKRKGGYEARIMVKGKAIYLGTYSSSEEAYSVYVSEKRKRHAGCTI
jgi:hypothetical protein